MPSTQQRSTSASQQSAVTAAVRNSIRRELTFWVSLADLVTDVVPACAGANSWVGFPAANGIGFPLHVACELSGRVHSETGMVLNVHEVDKRMRADVWPVILAVLRRRGESSPGFEELLGPIWQTLADRMPGDLHLDAIAVFTSTRLQYHMTKPDRIILSEQFEFSASHRLFNAEWTPEENQRHFGKCSRPGGHGHNYLVEVAVSGPAGSNEGRIISVEEFESVVKHHAIDRLDHRNLDQDVPELRGRPSTAENIAGLVFQWLTGRFDQVRLESVRVYETPRTFAECRISA